MVIVRDGALPSGADEAAAEADGSIALVGTRMDLVDGDALPSARTILLVECAWTNRVSAAVHAVRSAGAEIVIVPSSPDGRDLAPRVAARLRRPLFAGATIVGQDTVHLSRMAGRTIEEYRITEPIVATLIPGLRGSSPTGQPPVVESLPVDDSRSSNGPDPEQPQTVVTLSVLPPDAATIDLAEAPRIVAGGQGLLTTAKFEQLGRVGRQLGAALGGTRVASDAGWIPFSRQIGTTGVEVDPKLYLAFAISGATQHVSGLGNPDHIIAVNTDSSCPMMSIANLAIVSDANAVIDELEQRLNNIAMSTQDRDLP